MEYLIRKCEGKDLPTLVELCQKHAYYENAYYDVVGKQQLLSKAIFSDRPCLFCYVIESCGQLIGYFAYTFDFSTWEAQTFLHLDCLYLEPEFRGFKSYRSTPLYYSLAYLYCFKCINLMIF